MFIGTLERWKSDKDYLPNIFQQVIAFLNSIDPQTIAAGTHLIQGKNIFANVEYGKGKALQERRFELHRHYADVQMLLAGHERQDYTTSAAGELLEDRLEKDDVAFYAVTGQVHSLKMHPGMFVIYFPGELHAPGLRDDDNDRDYKKIVVKVAENLLAEYANTPR